MDPCDKHKAAQFNYSQLDKSFSILAKPAQRALIRNGICSSADLATWSRANIAELHGIGPTVMAKLDAILKRDGMEFDG